eukprot:65446_1
MMKYICVCIAGIVELGMMNSSGNVDNVELYEQKIQRHRHLQEHSQTCSLSSSLPPQSSTYSYNGHVRGYWFQSPVDFAFTGIDIPTTASTASMTAAIVRFNNGAPPIYSSVTNDFMQ